jgi:hypothetical protein
LALIAAAASLAAACRPMPEPGQSKRRPTIGVMTTLPLIWGEAADVGELLAPQARQSWVRQELENRFALEPLDTLDDASLAGIDRLVLAQPRALSPSENVSLDGWVRRGGKLLLFADPMLTRHSRFPVGDRRRPQDVALLSPILAHWGLELLFDEGQGAGTRIVEVQGMTLPVDLSGSFKLSRQGSCTLMASGLLARCGIGKGRVLALADAAVLDDPESESLAGRRGALGKLISLAFE